MKDKYKNLKILHLILEFPRWVRSRSWSYSAQFSLDDGLKAHGIECLTVNSVYLPKLRELCDGMKFDQVWIEIVHQPLDEDLLAWIAELAPVRIGFICESLEYSEADYQIFPHLRQRKELISARFKYLTHILTIDERDAENINSSSHAVRAMWWVSSIPERFMVNEISESYLPAAFFSGAVYGGRREWLEKTELAGKLLKQPSSEAWTPYPALYDVMQFIMSRYIKLIKPAKGNIPAVYLNSWLALREKCFSRWLAKNRQGCAIVNLPSSVKAYAGRVFEGMAAGVPVISWNIPERPRTEKLFEDGREILLYSPDNPLLLAEHIERVRQDNSFRREIATAALLKMKKYHTGEKRAADILEWIENGSEPSYE